MHGTPAPRRKHDRTFFTVLTHRRHRPSAACGKPRAQPCGRRRGHHPAAGSGRSGAAFGPAAQAEALIAGYTTAFMWSAVIFFAAFLVILFLLRAGRGELPADGVPVHTV
ncbi:hypothetical protein [Frankia sp. CiP1_Cm_nod2]